MSKFFEIVNRQGDLIAEYFRRVQAADDNFLAEWNAATKIQSTFRGSLVRCRYHDVCEATRHIQRVMRGVQGRARCASLLFQIERRKNDKFFDHCAACIQKYYRGFWSRKYVHSYYARKAYIDKVKDDGDRTVDYLRDRHNRLSEEAKEEAKRKAFEEYKGITADLHHLLSTHQIPGIYNPPFASDVPCAFGEPVEKHLRDLSSLPPLKSVKRPRNKKQLPPMGSPPYMISNLPEVSAGKKQLSTMQANIGRMAPVQGPFINLQEQNEKIARASKQFRTIQQSSKYDVVDYQLKMEGRLNKLTRLGPEDFNCRKPQGMKHLSSINAESKWADRPMEMREDYLEIARMPGKPLFHTHLKKNRQFWDIDPKEDQRGANHQKLSYVQSQSALSRQTNQPSEMRSH